MELIQNSSTLALPPDRCQLSCTSCTAARKPFCPGRLNWASPQPPELVEQINHLPGWPAMSI